MKIKVCGLNSTQNIKELITLQPDYIGLIFYPESKRFIGNDSRLQTYLRSVTTTQKTGVFVNAGYKTILESIDLYGLNSVQLHGDESPDFCACISGHIPVIKAFQINSAIDFNGIQDYKDSCSYFLFDAPTSEYGGSGKCFNWELLQHYTLSKPFFLSGGISPDNFLKAKEIKHLHMMGIDINSCFETEPGIKNIKQIKTIINEIRN